MNLRSNKTKRELKIFPPPSSSKNKKNKKNKFFPKANLFPLLFNKAFYWQYVWWYICVFRLYSSDNIYIFNIANSLALPLQFYIFGCVFPVSPRIIIHFVLMVNREKWVFLRLKTENALCLFERHSEVSWLESKEVFFCNNFNQTSSGCYWLNTARKSSPLIRKKSYKIKQCKWVWNKFWKLVQILAKKA